MSFPLSKASGLARVRDIFLQTLRTRDLFLEPAVMHLRLRALGVMKELKALGFDCQKPCTQLLMKPLVCSSSSQ